MIMMTVVVVLGGGDDSNCYVDGDNDDDADDGGGGDNDVKSYVDRSVIKCYMTTHVISNIHGHDNKINYSNNAAATALHTAK